MPNDSGMIETLTTDDYGHLPDHRIPLSPQINEIIIPCLESHFGKLLSILYKLSLIDLSETCYQRIIELNKKHSDELTHQDVTAFIAEITSIQLNNQHRVRNLIFVGNTFGSQNGNDFSIIFFIHHFFQLIDPSIQCKIIPGLNDYRFLYDLGAIIDSTFGNKEQQLACYQKIIAESSLNSTKNLARFLSFDCILQDTLLSILNFAVISLQLAHYFNTKGDILNVITSAQVSQNDLQNLKQQLMSFLELDECRYLDESEENRIRYSLEDIIHSFSEQTIDEKIHNLLYRITSEYRRFAECDASGEGTENLVLLRFAANISYNTPEEQPSKQIRLFYCNPDSRSGFSLISPDGSQRIYYCASVDEAQFDYIDESSEMSAYEDPIPYDFFRINLPPACQDQTSGHRHQFSIHELSINHPPSVTMVNQTDPTRENMHVFGDMHGNFMKLFQLLTLKGIIENNNKLYQNFLEVYTLPLSSYSEDMMGRINQLFQEIKFTPNEKKHAVLLLGDLLRDRGNSDYLMIRLLILLSRNCSLSIMLSNHDIEFLYAIIQTELLMREQKKNDSDIQFILEKYQNGFAMENTETTRSFRAILRLIELKLIQHSDLTRFIEDCYLPASHLFHFEYEDDRITFFSHAPFDFRSLNVLADQYAIPLSFASDREMYLMQLDALQTRTRPSTLEKFIDYIASLENERDKVRINQLGNPSYQEPRYHLIWSRELPESQPSSPHHENTIIIHGHNGADSFHALDKANENQQRIRHHYISLDNRHGFRAEVAHLPIPVSCLDFEQRVLRLRHLCTTSTEYKDASAASNSTGCAGERPSSILTKFSLHKRPKSIPNTDNQALQRPPTP